MAKRQPKLKTPSDIYDHALDVLDKRAEGARRMGYQDEAELTLRVREFFEKHLKRVEMEEGEKVV